MLCYVIVEYIHTGKLLSSLNFFFYFEFLFNSLLSERKERKNEEIEKMMMARPDGAIGCGGVK